MLAVVFSGTYGYNIAILPADQKMNNTFFTEYVLLPFTEVCDQEGRKPHERRVMVRFDNARIHNTEAVQ
jgi:hypothetical protein